MQHVYRKCDFNKVALHWNNEWVQQKINQKIVQKVSSEIISIFFL